MANDGFLNHVKELLSTGTPCAWHPFINKQLSHSASERVIMSSLSVLPRFKYP